MSAPIVKPKRQFKIGPGPSLPVAKAEAPVVAPPMVTKAKRQFPIGPGPKPVKTEEKAEGEVMGFYDKYGSAIGSLAKSFQILFPERVSDYTVKHTGDSYVMTFKHEDFAISELLDTVIEQHPGLSIHIPKKKSEIITVKVGPSEVASYKRMTGKEEITSEDIVHLINVVFAEHYEYSSYGGSDHIKNDFKTGKLTVKEHAKAEGGGGSPPVKEEDKAEKHNIDDSIVLNETYKVKDASVLKYLKKHKKDYPSDAVLILDGDIPNSEYRIKLYRKLYSIKGKLDVKKDDELIRKNIPYRHLYIYYTDYDESLSRSYNSWYS